MTTQLYVIKHCTLALFTGNYFLIHLIQVNGVKGAAVLCIHPPINLALGCVVDNLHCLYLGVSQALLKLWFSKEYSSKDFSLYKQVPIISIMTTQEDLLVIFYTDSSVFFRSACVIQDIQVLLCLICCQEPRKHFTIMHTGTVLWMYLLGSELQGLASLLFFASSSWPVTLGILPTLVTLCWGNSHSQLRLDHLK